jgi:hypothetical protein
MRRYRDALDLETLQQDDKELFESTLNQVRGPASFFGRAMSNLNP